MSLGFRRLPALILIIPAILSWHPAPTGFEAAQAPRPQIRLTVGEAALLRWLRAASPQVVTVGSKLVGTELILTEPSDLVLKEGSATLRFRLIGRQFPVDLRLTARIGVEYDAGTRQYFAVVSSLPIQLPGLGRLDLKDFLPRVAIPSLIEKIWSLEERTFGFKVRIRRIAILDQLLEVGVDADLTPMGAPGRAGSR